MMKRITATLTALMFLIQTTCAVAVGEYYEYQDRDSVSLGELVYTKTDSDAMQKLVVDLKNQVNIRNNYNKVLGLAGECLKMYQNISNSYAVATLMFDRDYNDINSKNYDEASKSAVEASACLSELIYTLYDSQYSDVLVDIFGDVESALYIALPDDADVIDLLDKERKLTNKYNDVYGNSSECAKLFVELVEVRNELARQAEYANYAEYANDVVYGRDFTNDELADLSDAVVGHFMPVYYEAMEAINTISKLPIQMTEDDVLLDTRAIMGRINSELLESFDYMIASNSYDVSYTNEKKANSGAYTLYLPQKGVPYLFINPTEDYAVDGVSGIHTLIHEFGHYSSMLNMPKVPYGGVLENPSIETSEIHSQALELLAEHHYGKLFGASASYERYYMMCNILVAILSGCYFNEWQTQIYAMENVTVDKVNDTAKLLAKKYFGIDFATEDIEGFWTTVPHNFTMPMYYLSYAVSALASLSLYSESVNDYDSAVDKYMQISAEGIYGNFSELIRDYEYLDVYDTVSIGRITNTIKSNYALGYPDIMKNSWYMPYVYTVSNLMYGRAEHTFMPDMPVTRSEFIGAIGRMYDYYVGIDGEYENTFKDTGAGDENIEYIAWAVSEGIVSGYDTDTFGGNDTLTREQAATVIYRLSKSNDDFVSADMFIDVDEISDWAVKSVGWATDNGIINGYDNSEFRPKSQITRAETAKILSCYIMNSYDGV